MEILLSDGRYLTPRLLDTDGGGGRRVTGVLEPSPPAPTGDAARVAGTEGAAGASLFVDGVDYDGHRCRYDVGGAAGASGSWRDEEDVGAYRAFSALVVDRLRTLGERFEPTLHRFPDGPPSRALARRLARLDGPRSLAVLDTCVTVHGRLWLRGRIAAGTGPAPTRPAAPERRARPGAARPRVEPVDGWLLLADSAAVFGEGAGAASADVPTNRRRREAGERRAVA